MSISAARLSKKAFSSSAWCVLCLTISWIVGCESTVDYRAALSGWQGASEAELLGKWGSPSATDELADGKKVLHFTETTAAMPRTGASQVPPQTVFEDGLYDRFRPLHGPAVTNNYDGTTAALGAFAQATGLCDTRFVISADAIVQSADYTGTGCVAQRAKLPNP